MWKQHTDQGKGCVLGLYYFSEHLDSAFFLSLGVPRLPPQKGRAGGSLLHTKEVMEK